MSKTKTIKLMNLETLNIVAWYKDFSEKKRNKVLPVRIQFDLQRNIMKLADAAQSLEKFREELVKDIQEEFFGNDEKSYEAKEVKTDEDDNPVLDENGKEVMVDVRKIKEEFEQEFKDKLEDADTKYREIAVDTDEYLIKVFDLDTFVDNLADDVELDLEDLNMLTFMDANKEKMRKNNIFLYERKVISWLN